MCGEGYATHDGRRFFILYYLLLLACARHTE